jgi:hypothetical protein
MVTAIENQCYDDFPKERLLQGKRDPTANEPNSIWLVLSLSTLEDRLFVKLF